MSSIKLIMLEPFRDPFLPLLLLFLDGLLGDFELSTVDSEERFLDLDLFVLKVLDVKELAATESFLLKGLPHRRKSPILFLSTARNYHFFIHGKIIRHSIIS